MDSGNIHSHKFINVSNNEFHHTRDQVPLTYVRFSIHSEPSRRPTLKIAQNKLHKLIYYLRLNLIHYK